MKWISVKEKLPNIGDKVLMFMAKFGDVKNAASEYFGCWLGEHWSYWDDHKESDCENNPDYWSVTHWMPLPPDPSLSLSTETGQQGVEELKQKIMEILRDDIYFSGQVNGWVVHGAVENIIKLFQSQPQEVGQDADGQKEPLYRWQEIKIDDDLPKANGIYETKDENGFVRQHFYDAAIPTKWRHLNPSLQRTENVVIRKSFITHWLCKVETPEQDESVCTHHYDFFAPNDSGNVVCKKCGKVL